MFEQLNWLAIVIATVVSMGIGAAWYSLLAQQWITACGFNEDEIKSVSENDQPIIYVIAAACHLVMAFVLCGVLFHVGGTNISTGDGVLTGFLIWLGFVLTSMTVNHRFQFKPWALTAIDSGHYLAVLVAQGAIIGWFGF